jgi:hypothetical protein
MADLWDLNMGLLNDAVSDTTTGFGVSGVYTHTALDGTVTPLTGADFQLIAADDTEFAENGQDTIDEARLDVKTSVLASAEKYSKVTNTVNSETWTVERAPVKDGNLRMILRRTRVEERSGGMRRSR